MADLLFDWLGFSYFGCVELDRHLQVWSNPHQSNGRSAIQRYFPLQSKYTQGKQKNTHRMGKCHCKVGLQFDWFGLNRFTTLK